MSTFTFALTDEEKTYLKDVVRGSIRAGLAGEDFAPPDPPTPKLSEELGAFVTLKLGGHLRGCIGNVIGERPLYTTVAAMARAAAFEDSRFPPLGAEEFEAVEVEISVLSPLTKCEDAGQVEVGRHGLIVQHGYRSGLLLPQVPVEWGWDRETFLNQTCAKAGLPGGCWKQPGTALYWFEAVVF